MKIVDYTSGYKQFLLKYSFIGLIIQIGFISPIWGSGYKQFLDIDPLVIYKHWNMKEKKITGYSRIKHEHITENGKEYILENFENSEADGKVFTRKKILFDFDSGEVVSYWEEDLRRNEQIRNTYKDNTIITSLKTENKTIELKKSRKSGLIPAEEMWFYLRKEIQKHSYSKEKKFTLYIPMILLQTDMFGSEFEMIVKKEKDLTIDTPLGKLPAIEILVAPQSALLRMFSQTNFRFIISTQAPNHILLAEQADTQYILESIESQ